MSKIEYNLENIVAQIEKISNQKAKKESKFNLEYIIGNVTEEHLTEIGFKFIEYSQYNRCPVYQLGNILALFDDQILHVRETII